jgi:hypothetical protein
MATISTCTPAAPSIWRLKPNSFPGVSNFGAGEGNRAHFRSVGSAGKSFATRTMSQNLDDRQTVPEEDYTPWWQITAVAAVIAAVCTGMCLLA